MTVANKRSDQLKGSAILLFASIIWGSAFVFQQMGMEHLGPFSFNGLRYFIGAAALLPVILIKDALYKKKNGTAPQRDKKQQFIAGLVCGAALFIPSALQQIGLQWTAPGKSGFITAMYIVTVPLLGLFLGKKAKLNAWIAVAIAVVGMYFLCVTEKFTIESGDTITLVSVVFWAVQILAIDHYAPKVDCIRLACMEFFVCGILSLVPMLIFEKPSFSGIIGAAVPLLYVGLMSCGIAYTLQPIGQKLTPPAIASIFMSLESVFSVLAGFVILGDTLSQRESIGCVLMFAAVLAAQLDFSAIFKKSEMNIHKNKEESE